MNDTQEAYTQAIIKTVTENAMYTEVDLSDPEERELIIAALEATIQFFRTHDWGP